MLCKNIPIIHLFLHSRGCAFPIIGNPCIDSQQALSGDVHHSDPENHCTVTGRHAGKLHTRWSVMQNRLFTDFERNENINGLLHTGFSLVWQLKQHHDEVSMKALVFFSVKLHWQPSVPFSNKPKSPGPILPFPLLLRCLQILKQWKLHFILILPITVCIFRKHSNNFDYC